jgi:hypothetical protein
VDQVSEYLRLGLYYGLFVGFWASYVVLLGYFLWNKQWLFVFLSLFFTGVFYPAGPMIFLGPLVAVVIGWQEAGKWNIKNLVRINSALLVICFLLLTRTAYVDFMKPKPKVDPAVAAKERMKRAAAAAAKKK